MANLNLSFLKVAGGYAHFRAEGYPVIYVPHSMLPSPPPQTMVLQAEAFAPVRNRATGGDPAKMAERAAKAEQRAVKLTEQAAKIRAELTAAEAPKAAEPAAKSGKKSKAA